MSVSEMNELAEVLAKVRNWNPALKITLARHILNMVETSTMGLPSSSQLPRGRPAAEIRVSLRSDRPAPDDETVRKWIDEYRMEKYGR